jgi:hypothetical protein
MEVLPGETVDIRAIGEIAQATTVRNYMGGVRYRWATFYVPHRLVWDDWIGYVTGEFTGTPNVNWVVEANRVFYDKVGVFSPRFLRASYQLVWNQFYRHPATAEDTTAVTSIDILKVDRSGLLDYDWGLEPTNDQEETYDVVAGSPDTVTIDMNELRNKLRLAARGRAESRSGDKYVDAMARYGVQLDWQTAERPEILGAGTWFQGQKQLSSTAAIGADELGQRVTASGTKAALSIGRKNFPEHGTVFTVMYSDPHNFNMSKDGQLGCRYQSRDDLFTPENAGLAQWVVGSTALSDTGFANLYYAPWQRYQQGEELMGAGQRSNALESWAWSHLVDSQERLLSGSDPSLNYYTDGPQAPAIVTNTGGNWCYRGEFTVNRINNTPVNAVSLE